MRSSSLIAKVLYRSFDSVSIACSMTMTPRAERPHGHELSTVLSRAYHARLKGGE